MSVDFENHDPVVNPYEHCIRKIDSNIFVTPDTLKYRAEMSLRLRNVKDRLKEKGLKADNVLFFMVGSTGAGLANEKENSDIEGFFLYDCDESEVNSYLGVFFDTELPESVDMVMYSRFTNLLENMQETLGNALIMPSVDQVHGFASLFAPSLHENIDIAERKVVNHYRKKMLEKIVKLVSDPEDRDTIWNLVNGYVSREYVLYELKDGEKRSIRVSSAIDDTLSERFGDNLTAKTRAKSFVDRERQAFKLPSFKQMCEIFEVS